MIKKVTKRSIVVFSTCFVISFISTTIGYFILSETGSHFASFVAGFCIFIAAQALAYKFIGLFFYRHVFEKKEKKSKFQSSLDKDGNEILEINPDVSIVFKTSPSSLFELIPFQNNKYLFYVCDVDSKKETCDIVKRVTLATFDAVKNPLVLEKTMQYLDKSIRLLNMKGVRISVLLGLVDTMNMKISFINASLYSLFTSKKNENSPLMPLVSNKYILATEKQLPFIVSEYRICKDDLISIAMEENI